MTSLCTDSSDDSAQFRCGGCGRPLDLRCEDCGCPVSCHDLVYLKDGKRMPYCVWDFGPCPREQRPEFFATVEAWRKEQDRNGSKRDQFRMVKHALAHPSPEAGEGPKVRLWDLPG